MSKLLKDATGIYNLDQVASIHPIIIRGNKNDQTVITAVNTAISTVGGQTHSTTIPWPIASATALDYWKGTAGPAAAAPLPTGIPVVTPGPAPTPTAPSVPVAAPLGTAADVSDESNYTA